MSTVSVDKQTMASPYDGMLLSNKIGQITDTYNRDESQSIMPRKKSQA